MKLNLIPLLMLVSSSLVHSAVFETIDAVVNDEPVFSSEVDEYLRLRFTAEELNRLQGSDLERARQEATRILIDNTLLLQAAQKELTQEQHEAIRKDVEARVNEVIDHYKNQFTSADELKREEQRTGVSLQQLRELKYQEIYRDYMQRVVVPQLVRLRVETPTDEEVRQFEQESGAAVSDGILPIAHVFLRVPEDASPEKEKEVLYMAQQIAKRAKDGEAFDSLVSRYSQHEATKSRGGIWEIEKGKVFQEFDPLFDLEPGAITDPIRTPAGYHIVKILRKNTPRDLLFQRKLEQNTREWLQELRQKAEIKVRQGSALTKVESSQPAPTSQLTQP